MIKIHYRNDLDKNIGHNSRNILSYKAEIKEFLPITEFGWRFIFSLIKHKIKHKKIFFFVMENNNEQTFNWFWLKK